MVFLISSGDISTNSDWFKDFEMKEIDSFNLFIEDPGFDTKREIFLMIKGKGNCCNVKSGAAQDCLEKEDGSFTAIEIDGDRLSLYRDLFGSRPVYFLEKDGEIFISDRIKPLLNFTEPRPEREVCMDYLHSGLVNHGRKTFFKGVKQLRPEEKLSYTDGELDIEEMDYQRKSGDFDLQESIRDSVTEKISGDTLVCPISGGVDSTILASLVKDRDATFIHSVFEADTGDEEYFELANEELGLEAEKVKVQVSELIDEIDESVEVFEQPTSMIAIQAQNILFREIKDAVGESVILDGTGADELFYGYQRFTPYYIADELKKNPINGLKELKKYRHHISGYELKKIFRLITGGFYSNSYSIPELDHRPDFDRPSTLREAGESNLKHYNFPHVLHALDKSREKYGHKLNLPFLSAQLKRGLEEIDPKENFESGLTKYLLRDAFREEPPREIFERKKKTGFVELEASDIDEGTNKKFEEVFGSKRFREREFFDGELFYRRFEKGMQGFFKCYRFYCFECWMRSFID